MEETDPQETLCGVSDFEKHVNDSTVNMSSWPMLIYEIINPVMHYIIRNKDGEKKLYIVSKEKWHGLYILISGKKEPRDKFHSPRNWFRMITKNTIDKSKDDKVDIFDFYTRKHGYKIFLIALTLIGFFGYLTIEIVDKMN